MGRKADIVQRELNRVLNSQRLDRQQREVERKRLISDIMKEITEKDFTIVTASGKVIAGRAIEASAHTKPVDMGSGAGWATFIPGPTTYSAQITLKPKH